jgi:hypothetical protein
VTIEAFLLEGSSPNPNPRDTYRSTHMHVQLDVTLHVFGTLASYIDKYMCMYTHT